jgi:hypothetical protein
MLNWFGRSLIVTFFLMLTACRASEPADLKLYLLQHPSVLRDEIARCEAPNHDSKRCEIVAAAATDMRALVDELQKHPQDFGKRILRAQIAFAETGKGEDDIKILLAVVGLTGPE